MLEQYKNLIILGIGTLFGIFIKWFWSYRKGVIENENK